MTPRLAVMFPGSGSQYPGMIRRLHREEAVVRETFEEASSVLGYDLAALCLGGSLAELVRLRHLLPALFVTGVAHHRVFARLGAKPDFMLGHSLGTFTALTCAGALSLADGLRLVVLRGDIAERVNAACDCAVTVIQNTSLDAVRAACREISPQGDWLAPACVNGPREVMVAGRADELLAFEQLVLSREAGAKVVPLVGGAPFHTPLMQPYEEELAAAVAQVSWSAPACAVIDNVDARSYASAEDIAARLPRQICQPVRWQDSLELLARRGVGTLVELGPQSVLKKLALDMGYPGRVFAFDDLADREALGAHLGGQAAQESAAPRASEVGAAGSIVTALEAAAERFADRPAIHHADGSLSYRELHGKANRLARRLSAAGVGPDAVVAVGLERSPDLLVALFAILKAGGAYLPLRPTEPPERLDYMLGDSGARWLVTRRGQLEGCGAGVMRVHLDEPEWWAEDASPLGPAPSPGDLVYLIYTSGSTGRPKGVALEHGPLANRLRWMQAAYPIDESDVLFQKTVPTFDVSVWELFWWALHGASVVLLPSGKEHDPRMVTRLVERHGVTVVHFVPSLLDLFLEYAEIGRGAERIRSLRRVFVSGEKLSASSVARFYALTRDRAETEMVNLYGPTEAAIDVSYHRCRREPPYEDVPIGRAIDGVRLSVLDGSLQPVADGETGELYIAGVCLARGYRNNPRQTAQAFSPDPSAERPGERMYRTGDRVRRDAASGEIHYLGRGDSQIKLRGLRIELGEIEHQLRDGPGVREAAVVVVGEGGAERYVHAAVALDPTADPEALWTALRQRLPEYMWPAGLLVLDELPKLSNGKIDRKSLQVQAASSPAATTDLRAAVAPAGRHPLSPAQTGIWLAHQLRPDTSAMFNNPAALRLSGRLDLERLETAVDTLVARHELLRVAVVDGAEGAEQLADQHRPRLQVEPWSGDEEALRRELERRAAQPFALDEATPLARFTLLALAPDDHVLLVNLHHVIADGWSKAVLLDELLRLLSAAGERPEDVLPPPAGRFFDYVAARRQRSQGDEHRRDVDYWITHLVPPLPVLGLPYRRPRRAAARRCGGLVEHAFGSELTATLKQAARDLGSPLFSLLLAGFSVLLQRYSGQRDLVVGVPFAGRTEAGFERTVGPFVHALPIRVRIDPELSFSQLVAQVRAAAREAVRHQRVAFEEIVEAVAPRSSQDGFPIFQVTFQLDNLPMPALAAGALKLRPIALDTGLVQMELSVSLQDTPRGLEGQVGFAADLFDAPGARRFASQLAVLLAAAAADPERAVDSLPALAPDDEASFARWNATAVAVPGAGGVYARICRRLAEDSSRPAVELGVRRRTYGELGRAAAGLAERLRRVGVTAGDRVPILMPAGGEQIAAQLAAWSLGAAFVPLDPVWPPARRHAVLAETGARAILVSPSLAEALDGAGLSVVVVPAGYDDSSAIGAAALPVAGAAADEADAAVVYTSGTTGRPKGVRLTHRNLLNLAASFIDSYAVDGADAVLPVTATASSSYLGESFPALAAGARLVLAEPDRELDPEALCELIDDHRVTILSTVPSVAAALDPLASRLKCLRLLICGGEALEPRHVRRLRSQVEVINSYGLTEGGVCSTYHRLAPVHPDAELRVPVGRPVVNTRVYVLSPAGRLQPIGAPGELHLAGDGLAAGYLDGRLDAERFVPFPPWESRLLRTGDVARWLPDGELELLGRCDRQIQIRGHRVEPAEIERCLLRVPGVAAAWVAPRRDGKDETVLVAFVEPAPGADASPQRLRAGLAQDLPVHMLPAAFVAVETLPVDARGDIDEDRLPAVPAEAFGAGDDLAPPETETERQLAAIWCELLGRPRVGVTANFFDVGGHSLLLARLRARIRQSLGRDVPLVELFRSTTIRRLARHLDGAPAEEPAAVAPSSGSRAELRRAALAAVGWVGRRS